MKLKVTRHVLMITPENETDEAYIEEVLGLRNDGEVIQLRRTDAKGFGCIAYLETETVEQAKKRTEAER